MWRNFRIFAPSNNNFTHFNLNNLKENREMEKELNVIEQAIKVTSFRKLIRECCRKKGLEYPSDEKIAEYIESGCAFDVDDFMGDYESKIGVFKDPFVDFKAEIEKMDWIVNKPTEEEMRAFFNTKGNNIQSFVMEHNINSFRPLERDVLFKILKLPTFILVELWNDFILESSIYGEDSYIYDLDNDDDIKVLTDNMSSSDLKRVRAINNTGVRYIQWLSLNDGSIKGVATSKIKPIIVGHWGEIFERILSYPKSYNEFVVFEHIFPILVKHLGYKFNENKGCFEFVKKD